LTRRDIVVVGASAGGIEAITTLLRDLPADLGASMFIVLHISPQSPGYLAEIFDKAGPLPVVTGRDREAFTTGKVYVAPADHHLLLAASGCLCVTRGPPEHRARPAIDPLFRSAAVAFGPRVIGVVLSGALRDGSAGLREVKMSGGTTVVQDPADALVDSMPSSALRNADVDYCRPAADLAFLIGELVRTEAQRPTPPSGKLRRASFVASGDCD